MKILFIFHTPTFKGGASKSGMTLVKGLIARGHDVLAICPGEDSLARTLRESSVPVNVLLYNWTYPHFKNSFIEILKYVPKYIYWNLINAKAQKQLISIAKEFQPDIIHTNSGVADIGFKVASELGLPHVTHYREFGWQDCNAIMWHEKRMQRYPKQYGIAIGKEILAFHSKHTDSNTLIYNGIIHRNSQRFSEHKASWFLYVGGLFKEKGIEDLLYAYSALPEATRKSHHLKIAGSTDVPGYFEHLKKMSSTLGIKESVEWLGERHDVLDLMYEARALIIPSHHEAFGRIMVEAINNGCLVIGRNTDGIKEQFDNGVDLTGQEIGFRYNSVDQLTDLLKKVSDEDSMSYQTMIKNGQHVINALYDIEGYIAKTEELYREAIKK